MRINLREGKYGEDDYIKVRDNEDGYSRENEQGQDREWKKKKKDEYKMTSRRLTITC